MGRGGWRTPPNTPNTQCAPNPSTMKQIDSQNPISLDMWTAESLKWNKNIFSKHCCFQLVWPRSQPVHATVPCNHTATPESPCDSSSLPPLLRMVFECQYSGEFSDVVIISNDNWETARLYFASQNLIMLITFKILTEQLIRAKHCSQSFNCTNSFNSRSPTK